MNNRFLRGVKSIKYSKKPQVLVYVLVFAGIGSYFLYSSFAQKPFVKANEPNKLSQNQEIVSNEILLKVKKNSKDKVKLRSKSIDTGLTNINRLNAKNQANIFEPLVKPSPNSDKKADVFQWYKITLNSPKKIVKYQSRESEQLKQTIEEYKNDPDVEAAVPNFTIKSFAVPNDSYFNTSGLWGQSYDDMWNLKKINMPAAWDIAADSTNIIVANIDTGIDRIHPDLANNIWSNAGEKGTTTSQGIAPNCTSQGLAVDKSCNNIDDDNNGYIDDTYGWNFADNTNDTIDRYGHGTHTAGTIGAVGNNGLGVTGVNWNVKLMPVKIFHDDGSSTADSGTNGLVYAADMGAKVSNNSWGGWQESPNPVTDAVDYQYQKGTVTVVSAGNDSMNSRYFTPANAEHAVVVAASGTNDQWACFSNWGERIDVIAPGGDSANCGGSDDAVLSTRSFISDPNLVAVGAYGLFAPAKGTSMAGPHVAGLAALIRAKYPSANLDQIRQVLRVSAKDLGAVGQDAKYGFGRIDAAKALATNPATMIIPSITSPLSGSKLPGGTVNVVGSANGTNFNHYDLEIAKSNEPENGGYTQIDQSVGSWTKIATSTTKVTNSTLGTINSSQYKDGKYYIRLTVTDNNGQIYRAEIYDLTIHNFNGRIVSPVYEVSQGRNEINAIAEVVGTGLSFASYRVEWGSGDNPTSWNTTGISLTSPTQTATPVDRFLNSQGRNIGIWDTTSLVSGQTYTLRLTINASNGSSSQYLQTYIVDRDIAPGWPKSICNGTSGDSFCNNASNSVPILADISGDSKKEVIFFNGNKQIAAYNQDGSTVPGFPYSLPNDAYIPTTGNAITTTDIDNNGKQDIIFATQQVFTYVQNGQTYSYIAGHYKLRALNGNGTLTAGWIPPTFFAPDSGGWPNQTPAISDINGDGKNEIILTDRPDIQNDPLQGEYSGKSRLHAYTNTGSELPGFPILINHNKLPGETVCTPDYCYTAFPDVHYPPPVIADIDADNSPDIIWGISNQLFVFDSSGRIKPGWPFTAPDKSDGKKYVFGKKPAVGDLDRDGKKEIIGMVHAEQESADDSKIYALKPDGSVVSGWPHSAYGQFPGSIDGPIVADVDNDGKDDVLTNGLYETTDANGDHWRVSPKIIFANGNSETQFQTNMKNNRVMGSQDSTVTSLPIVFDSLGNGRFTILSKDIFPTLRDEQGNQRPEGMSLTDYTGANIWTKIWPERILFSSGQENGIYHYGSSIIGTFSANDNQLYMLDTAQAFGENGSGSSVYMWRLPASIAKPKQEWSTFAHDNSNTSSSVIDNTAPTSPTSLTTKNVTYNKLDLLWNASTDNRRVDGYLISRNSQLIGFTRETTYTDINVSPNTGYIYEVSSIDESLNYSTPAFTGVTTPSISDTESPTTPTNLTTTSITNSQINISWTASSDNIGVVGYDVFRQSKKIATVTGTSFGDASVFSSTGYVYTVKARDAAGNVSAPSVKVSAKALADSSSSILTGTTYYHIPPSENKLPLKYVLINIPYKGTNHYYRSKSYGEYKIIGIPSGNQTIIFSKSSFVTTSYNVNLVSGQQNTLLADLPVR